MEGRTAVGVKEMEEKDRGRIGGDGGEGQR